MLSALTVYGSQTKALWYCSIKIVILSLWLPLAAHALDDKAIAIKTVANSQGLIAFWDFKKEEKKTWTSYFDPKTITFSLPVFLRQLKDPQHYKYGEWPYSEYDSSLMYDKSGPFGQAVRFNKGFIYGEVPRELFEHTSLNIHNRQAFTMIAWAKFIGKRHMVAGIWDEGGWNKYAGQRQVALFAGLFNQKGVIAHISATGAASFPQSNIDGAQYARLRAIDGQAFDDNSWVAMAMTYQPKTNEVRAYLNGEMTQLSLADPVTQDVLGDSGAPLANPFSYKQAIYSPKTFLIKYNGYNFHHHALKEHSLWVDLESNTIKYFQQGSVKEQRFSLYFDITRQGKSLLNSPINSELINQQQINLVFNQAIKAGDVVNTRLSQWQGDHWQRVGTEVLRTITVGAPFTFGRALGLGSDKLDSGSSLYIDGVAVFNRVLTKNELKRLSFIDED